MRIVGTYKLYSILRIDTHRYRGLPNAFGVFQTYYVDTLMPDVDAASVAWIGSIQLFFTTVGCLPAGILLDRGYLKSLIAVGTVLEVVGLILTSFFKSFWAILFAQGVCMGIGSGLLAIVPVVVLAMFFEKKRMLATGLASTGASVGKQTRWSYPKRVLEVDLN